MGLDIPFGFEESFRTAVPFLHFVKFRPVDLADIFENVEAGGGFGLLNCSNSFADAFSMLCGARIRSCYVVRSILTSCKFASQAKS